VDPRSLARSARQRVRSLRARARTEVDWRGSRGERADLAVFHEFLPPPTGGGSQFLRALTGELRRRGLQIELNRISGATPVCLFNSFNFDFARLQRFARPGCRLVHRVDGPIGSYRAFDDGTTNASSASTTRLPTPQSSSRATASSDIKSSVSSSALRW